MKSNYLVGIDIGTKKICTLIAQIKSDGGKEDVEIIGYGVAESRGLRKGNIVNMEGTVEDIKRSDGRSLSDQIRDFERVAKP